MTDLRKHQIIALLSFIILVGVLFYLTYNTFVLKDKQYQTAEKEMLKKHYESLIKYDNIYPGGYPILWRNIEKNLPDLESHYLKAGSVRNSYSDSLLIQTFHELIVQNPMDSIFNKLKSAHHLTERFEYLITVNSIKLRFANGVIQSLFDEHERYNFLDKGLQTNSGFIVGGHLASPLLQNRIYNVTMGTSLDYSYDITFSFYADKSNRKFEILKAAMPTFLVTLFALSSVMIIYYITFKNWLKQKKLTEMKSDFINSITHEFHTPIATIMVANKSLQNEKVLSNKDSVKNLTEVIYRQSKRLEALFGQVLNITGIDKSSIEKEEVILDKLIQEIVKDYQLKVADENIQIRAENQQPDSRISLNKFWFTTMLFNIFDNAIKYNDKAEKIIFINIKPQKDGIILLITDNGIGMEDRTLKNIYDKFHRANQKTMSTVNGLGLGLYYTKQCCDAHDWKIQVNSKIGVGTEFLIYIS